jgi:citrate lyase subunit beta / citryl-CoA lyase
MDNKYLMRSLMFVPGHNPRLLASASRTSADVLLLDLEDSVQPVSNKQVARDTIQEWVEQEKFKNHHVFPRVNDRESGQLLKDIYQLSIPGVDGFMYPKSKNGQDVYFFSKLLETIEYEKGIEPGTFKIIPLIETAAAVLNVQKIAQASSRVVAIAFGCEDFIDDLGGIHDRDGRSIFTARARISMAAREAGVIPVDTVHIKVKDLVDLEKNLVLACNLGFEGMLVLHPGELPLVHKYFSPSEKKLTDAEEMLALSSEAEADGMGVALMKGKFIGPPMVKMAKKVLARQKMVESTQAKWKDNGS